MYMLFTIFTFCIFNLFDKIYKKRFTHHSSNYVLTNFAHFIVTKMKILSYWITSSYHDFSCVFSKVGFHVNYYIHLILFFFRKILKVDSNSEANRRSVNNLISSIELFHSKLLRLKWLVANTRFVHWLGEKL